MTELIANIGKRISKADSLGLTVVYTIGHIFIATICVYFITGAPLNLAAADAVSYTHLTLPTTMWV